VKIQIVNLKDLMTNTDQYIDSQLLLHGQLVVQDDRIVLMSGGLDEGDHLKISDRGFLNRLLENVPCFIGSKHLYCDPVSITGYILRSEEGPVLQKIVKVILVREGATFEF
jgi:hypothetical protein